MIEFSKLIFFYLLILGSTSCETGVASINTPPIDNDFSKHYKGYFNKTSEIQMILTKNGQILNGKYSIKDHSVKFDIIGNIDNKGNLTLNEYDVYGNNIGIFKGILVDKKITGYWSKPDGSKRVHFELTESLNSIEKKQIEKAKCSEIEKPNSGLGPPLTIKTCYYKNFKIVSKGFPDYKGIYSHEDIYYYKNSTGNYLKIKNEGLFNNHKNELLSLLNNKIKVDFNELLQSPDSDHCLNTRKFRPFNFNEIRITFEENKINFSVEYGLCSACRALDGTSISMDLSEIQKYLKE